MWPKNQGCWLCGQAAARVQTLAEILAWIIHEGSRISHRRGLLDRERSLSDAAAGGGRRLAWPFAAAGGCGGQWRKALPGRAVPPGDRDVRRAPSGLRLNRAGAERERDAPPRVEMRRCPWQMQDDAARRADDMHPQLQQPVAQPRHLGAGTAGARRPQPQLPA